MAELVGAAEAGATGLGVRADPYDQGTRAAGDGDAEAEAPAVRPATWVAADLVAFEGFGDEEVAAVVEGAVADGAGTGDECVGARAPAGGVGPGAEGDLAVGAFVTDTAVCVDLVDADQAELGHEGFVMDASEGAVADDGLDACARVAPDLAG